MGRINKLLFLMMFTFSLGVGCCPEVGEMPAKFSSSPTLVDIDGDGMLEVVVGNPDGRVYAVKADGGYSILCESQKRTPIYSSPLVSDIDRDGKMEVIFTSSSWIYCCNLNGDYIWKLHFPNMHLSSPSAGDLDGDGKLEIGVWGVDDRDVSVAKLYIIEESGEVKWSISFNGYLALEDIDIVNSVSYYFLYAGDFLSMRLLEASSPLIGDIDNDGKADVVVPGEVSERVIPFLKGEDGSFIKTVYDDRGGFTLFLADFDTDSELEVKVGGRAYSAVKGVTRPEAIFGWGELPTKLDVFSDVNRDGTLEEVVVVSPMFANKRLSCGIERDGWWVFGGKSYIEVMYSDPITTDYMYIATLWKREFPINDEEKEQNWFFSFPAIGDINGDGVLDIVVWGKRKVYALDGRTGDGIIEYETKEDHASSPALGDIDGDGFLDIAIGSQKKALIIHTDFKVPSPAFLPWPEFGGYGKNWQLDPWEYNDTITSATPLIDLSRHGAIPGYIWREKDVDWYYVNVDVGEMLEVQLRDIPEGRDYDLYLYDGYGNLLSSSKNSGSESEYILYPCKNPGRYYIKVVSSSGHSSTIPYSLYVKKVMR